MKKLLFFTFFCLPVMAFSQVTPPQPGISDAQTFGYVNGIRIDSIKAVYAQFEGGTHRLFFNYGQTDSRLNNTVNDKQGNPLIFTDKSISFLLNFFYFNGWQLTQAYYSHYDGKDLFIMKKTSDK